MLKNIKSFFKNLGKKHDPNRLNKDEAKERLHLVLLQDRANVSADFLDMMKQEIIEVIKKYIDIDEKEMDVKLTNKQNSDGTTGAPALYANIPIIGIKSETRKKTNKIKLKELDNEAEKEKSEPEKNNKKKVVKNKVSSKTSKAKKVTTKASGKKVQKAENKGNNINKQESNDKQKISDKQESKDKQVNNDKQENNDTQENKVKQENIKVDKVEKIADESNESINEPESKVAEN